MRVKLLDSTLDVLYLEAIDAKMRTWVVDFSEAVYRVNDDIAQKCGNFEREKQRLEPEVAQSRAASGMGSKSYVGCGG